MEVHNTLGLDVVDMCLVSGLVIPQKFKVPHFDKNKGVSYLRTHLRAYCYKMAAYTDDDKLLVHSFLDSLIGASFEWYMQLKQNHVHTWMNLTKAFLGHYQYNIDMALNQTKLQDMSQKINESFKQYMQR